MIDFKAINDRYRKRMEQLQSGGVLLFTSFPVDQMPMMQLMRVERLSEREIQTYKPKIVRFLDWERVEEWETVKEFIVEWLGSWYLVHLLWPIIPSPGATGDRWLGG